ncbi:hypothetical protein AVEN_495-1 [Araneus ventricosus]|uniref:Uncharacterized protein n=1 Tax=Araneus ventricosus TaxID=182803 RepID=A0A4Y2QER9_ARAVE|nr:hypothetical protein AVEN_495-1 [Araneus ventricosus]
MKFIRKFLCGFCCNKGKDENVELLSVKMLPDDYYDQEFKCINILNEDLDISNKLPLKNTPDMPEIIGNSVDMENLNAKSNPNSDGENSEEIVSPDVESLLRVKMLPSVNYGQEFASNDIIDIPSYDLDMSDKLPSENRPEMQEIIGPCGDVGNLKIISVPNSQGENTEENAPATDVNVQLFPCDLCHNHKSRTMKGQRLHLIWTHKIGREKNRSLDSHGRPLDYFDIHDVTPESIPDFDTDDPEELFELQMKWAMEESALMAAAQ